MDTETRKEIEDLKLLIDHMRRVDLEQKLLINALMHAHPDHRFLIERIETEKELFLSKASPSNKVSEKDISHVRNRTDRVLSFLKTQYPTA